MTEEDKTEKARRPIRDLQGRIVSYEDVLEALTGRRESIDYEDPPTEWSDDDDEGV